VLEKNESSQLGDACRDLYLHWEAYENGRVEKLTDIMGIDLDFYVAFLDSFGQLLDSFDERFEQNFKEKVDFVSRYSEGLLAVIQPNESIGDVTEDELNNFVDICDELSVLNAGLELDDVRSKSVNVLDLIGEVVQA